LTCEERTSFRKLFLVPFLRIDEAILMREYLSLEAISIHQSNKTFKYGSWKGRKMLTKPTKTESSDYPARLWGRV